MRPNTKIWFGSRNVGDLTDSGTIEYLPLGEALKQICAICLEGSVANRWDFCISHREASVRNRITGTRADNKLAREQLEEFLDSMLAEPAEPAAPPEATAHHCQVILNPIAEGDSNSLPSNSTNIADEEDVDDWTAPSAMAPSNRIISQ